MCCWCARNRKRGVNSVKCDDDSASEKKFDTNVAGTFNVSRIFAEPQQFTHSYSPLDVCIAARCTSRLVMEPSSCMYQPFLERLED